MQAGKCVHYTGTINACCEAGVNYKELAGPPETGYMRRLPCIAKYATGPDVKPCGKRREPTGEELAASEKESDERFERIGRVRAAIVAALGGPWKMGMGGHDGQIACPCCGGKVQFSRSGYNGHIRAACSTPDCASWVE